MYQCGACRYGWLWGRATRVTEHLNIGVKEQVRDGHHRANMNRTVLQRRQRLSATNELLAKMELDGATDDVGHGANDAQEEGNNEEQDGRPGMVVMTHKFWSFAVHRSEVTPRLHGERATVGGKYLRQIVLDLRRSSHPAHTSGSPAKEPCTKGEGVSACEGWGRRRGGQRRGALYVYNNWSMQWGLHPGRTPT